MLNEIRIDQVQQWYREVKVFDPIDLRIRGGELALIQGPNGSGKTSVLRCLCGLDRYQGSILFDGSPTRPRSSVVFDDPSLPGDVSVRWIFRMYRQPVDNGLEMGITGDLLARKVRDLSFGQRKRLAISVALGQNTPLVLLDEPLAGIDDRGKSLFKDVLAKALIRGVTVLSTTHQPIEFDGLVGTTLRLQVEEELK